MSQKHGEDLPWWAARDREADPDVYDALRLAEWLQDIAHGLENGSIRDPDDRWRQLVRALVAAENDISDPRETVADNKARDYLLALIKNNGQPLRRNRHDASIERLIDLLAEGTVSGAKQVLLGPVYAARLDECQPLIREIFHTYAVLPGGRGRRSVRGRPEMVSELCKRMGWTPSTDSIRKARQRRRKR